MEIKKREAWPGYVPGPELVKALRKITAEMESGERNYTDTTDSAKAIRATLKDHYPGIKFRVRSKKYSGGSSIGCGWTDGPDPTTVDILVQPFSGATFDGMIDLKEYHSSGYNGLEIHWGADFIFTGRHLSDEGEAAIMQSVCADLGVKDLEEYREAPGLFNVPGYGEVWEPRDVLYRASLTISL